VPAPASHTRTHPTAYSAPFCCLLAPAPASPRAAAARARAPARCSFLPPAWLGEPCQQEVGGRRGDLYWRSRGGCLAARRSGAREGGRARFSGITWRGAHAVSKSQAFVARGRDLALAAEVKPAVRSRAERRPPPAAAAMAGSDEVNRNECKVRARLPPVASASFLPSLGFLVYILVLISSRGHVTPPSLRPAPAPRLRVSEGGGGVLRRAGAPGRRCRLPLYDSVDGRWIGASAGR
jgi:hypothetical protein